MASASGENEEPLIISFRDTGTEEIFDGEDSKAARKTLPAMLHGKAGGTLDRLNSAVSLRSLSLPGLLQNFLYRFRNFQYLFVPLFQSLETLFLNDHNSRGGRYIRL